MSTFYDLPERSRSLISSIQQIIAQNGGRISFATFMHMALYHPNWGYYTSDALEIGEHGDFTTAPEISSLFTQCLARQIQEVMQHLGPCDLLELGAGSGRLAKDLLCALEQAQQLPEHYYIYEISPALRKKQQKLLQKHCSSLFSRIVWVDEIPKDLVGVIIANEVLDALPVQRFQSTETGVEELCVAWKNDELVEISSSPMTPELQAEAQKIVELYHLSPNYKSELCLALSPFIQTLSSSLTRGVILFADYGYGQSEYYHPQRVNGTLTCFYQHQSHTNPFFRPGMQDITAHVDFTRVIEVAAEQHCQLLGFTTQAGFLMACGLLDLAAAAEMHLTPAQQVNLHRAIKVLTLPTEMGEVIKIMGLGKNWDIPLLGFRLQDRRRDL